MNALIWLAILGRNTFGKNAIGFLGIMFNSNSSARFSGEVWNGSDARNFKIEFSGNGKPQKPYCLFSSHGSNDHISPTKAAAESNRIHYPPTDLTSNNSGKRLFSLDSRYCILSAMYMDKGNHIIRVYNSSSFDDTLIIKTIRVIGSCEVIDLKSLVIEDRKTIIDKRGLSVSVTVSPSEILTLSIKLTQ